MPIFGVGIDLVELARVERELANPDSEFVDGWFTPTELALADTGPNRASFFAGRVAAKEAVVKALGTGFSQGVVWTDIEIGRELSGRPTVRLSGRALEVATGAGVTRWHVSIAHTASAAVATAVGES